MSSALKIIKNAGYVAVGRVWLIGINLLLTPLILSYLGDEQFAVWVLFGVFSAYYMLMDFGLEVSLIRDVAIATSKQESNRVNLAFNSVLFFYLAFGAFALLFFWLLSPWILGFLSLSPSKYSIALDVTYWAIPIFIMISVTHVLTALHRGMQRYDIVTKSMLLVSVPNVLGSYLTLEWGFDIVGLLFVMLLVYSLQAVILIYDAKHIFPELRFSMQLFSWGTIRQMMPIGARVQVSKLADLASFQMDKVLLALLVPVQFVTMYDLGAKLATLVRDLPVSLTSAVFPAAAGMHGKNDSKRMWLLYDRGSKYLLMVTVPMLLGLELTADLVIGLWLGHVSEAVHQTVMVLGFAYWIVISLSMVFNIGTSVGWAKPIMQSAIFQAVFNVMLSYELILEFGFIGALYGTSIAIFTANSVLYFRFCRHFKQSVRLELLRLWLTIRANILPFIACYAYILWVGNFLVEGDRIQSLFGLLSAIFIYGIIYILSLRWFSFFDATDERLLVAQIPMIRWFRAGASDDRERIN